MSFLSDNICVYAQDIYVSNTKPFRKTLKFILAKISEKIYTCFVASINFSFILIGLSVKIESRIRKYKSSKMTLQMSFLS